MKRLLVGVIIGMFLGVPVAYAGFGWWSARVTLAKDHKKGETVECSTGYSAFKIVSCTEATQ